MATSASPQGAEAPGPSISVDRLGPPPPSVCFLLLPNGWNSALSGTAGHPRGACGLGHDRNGYASPRHLLTEAAILCVANLVRTLKGQHAAAFSQGFSAASVTWDSL